MPMPRAAKSALRVALTLAVLLTLGWLVAWPLYDDELPRVQANEGPTSVAPLLDAVSRFYADNHRLPRPGDGLGDYGIAAEPHVADVQVSPDTLVITITYKGRREIDGKKLVLTPEADAKGELKWRCTLPDIEPRWWPDYCRPKTH